MSASPAALQRVPWAGVAASGPAAFSAPGWVLPLSRVHHRAMPLSDVIGELFSHIFLFGIVIALRVARAVAAAGRRP